jgi:transposase InsO family protein
VQVSPCASFATQRPVRKIIPFVCAAMYLCLAVLGVVVLDALNMAIHNRRPAPGLVHHSDRGSQYPSVEFGKRLKDGIDPLSRTDQS